MSRLTVRRVTPAVLLLSILGFALPAAAAPAGRAHTAKPSVVLGHSLLDQVVSWLSGLLPSQIWSQESQEKGTVLSGSGTENAYEVSTQDRGGMIDPNGNS